MNIECFLLILRIRNIYRLFHMKDTSGDISNQKRKAHPLKLSWIFFRFQLFLSIIEILANLLKVNSQLHFYYYFHYLD